MHQMLHAPDVIQIEYAKGLLLRACLSRTGLDSDLGFACLFHADLDRDDGPQGSLRGGVQGEPRNDVGKIL